VNQFRHGEARHNPYWGEGNCTGYCDHVHNGEFNDENLVAVYDAEFRWSREDDFFLSLVNETPAARVLDLGCGTGRLALGLSDAGHSVIGIDPAPASIEAARRKLGSREVEWIVGEAEAAPSWSADVAIMTSHVAQFIIGDSEWSLALANLRRALVPDGRLIFDSRDRATSTPTSGCTSRWSTTPRPTS
jgi:ubiquinone/menaquinone biosynthesis C-methylase UbiE